MEKEMSYLQELEMKYIAQAGLKQNEDLAKLIEAISVNNGKYIGDKIEDDIWNAAELTNIERFSDELFFVDPVYDTACKQAFDDIYYSYKNGTKVGDLPLVVLDSVMYTGIFGVEDPNDWINTWRVLKHPFLEPGTTVMDVAEQNPQFLVIIQRQQNTYLSNKNNSLEGSEYYYLSPFDTSAAIEGNTVRSSVLSPTRVVRTFLSRNIQPKNDQSDLLIVTSCAVGENRNW